MTRKRDWSGIRDRYITSAISLRDLAREARVPFGSLHKVAKREDWQHARRAVGDRRLALVTQAAAKLSLPERSAKLREQVVTELEVDTALVAQSPPKSLADSEQRQAVLSGVVRNAETTLMWNEKKSEPAVRIHILGSAIIDSQPGPSLPALPASIDVDTIPPHNAA